MSYLPIESMKTGGLFWFPDLTSADPYFILPLLCAGTMLLTIEVNLTSAYCLLILLYSFYFYLHFSFYKFEITFELKNVFCVECNNPNKYMDYCFGKVSACF